MFLVLHLSALLFVEVRKATICFGIQEPIYVVRSNIQLNCNVLHSLCVLDFCDIIFHDVLYTNVMSHTWGTGDIICLDICELIH